VIKFKDLFPVWQKKPLLVWVCGLAVVSPLVWAVLLNFGNEKAGDRPQGKDGKNYPYEKVAPDIYWRIQNEQVIPLQAETLGESLERLWNIDMYVWPALAGWGEGGSGTFPLVPKEGTGSVNAITSNRRFLKVLAELSALPKDQTNALVNAHLEKCFPVYNKLFAGDFEKLKPYFDLDSELEPFAISHQGGNNPDGSPTLLGARFKILALALIAANLELKGTHENMKKVSLEGVLQYSRLADSKKYNERPQALLKTAGLYCRQIVAGALVKTCPDPQKEIELFKEYSLHWEHMDMPQYDAAATPFDLTARVVPPDFSKGKLVIRYVSNMTDQVFFSLGRKMDKENWEKARP
jgi:hypothetical protein